MEYGLIGERVFHSYSKIIHEKFNMYEYELHSVCFDQLKKILKAKRFKGLNITIPYKKDVLPLCEKLDITAKSIGSVNTIVLDEDDVINGYNTDYFGLRYTIDRSNISLKNKKVLILGSGGTSLTAQVLASDLQAKEILIVSTRGNLNYKTVYEHINTEIIINTTPVGMYPQNGEKLIDISKFKNLSGLIDVVYNPFYTSMLLDAKKHNILVAGGLPMLVAQAKASAELFKNKKLDDRLVEKTIKEVVKELSNIVLIGMPGSGKTAIGKLISEELNKEFVDLDEEIEKIFQTTLPEIFKKHGEKEFRRIECEVLKKYGKMNNLSLSTGGGIILNENNYLFLKQNGRIYWLKRDLDLLETKGRPLSKNLNELKKIYQNRKFLYQNFSDKTIYNNGLLNDTVQKILKDVHDNICY